MRCIYDERCCPTTTRVADAATSSSSSQLSHSRPLGTGRNIATGKNGPVHVEWDASDLNSVYFSQGTVATEPNLTHWRDDGTTKMHPATVYVM